MEEQSLLLVISCTIASLNLFWFSSDTCGDRRIELEAFDLFHLTSPNYPLQYDSYRTCTWEIQAQSGFIVVNILDFETEKSRDSVTIAGPGLELGDIAEGSGDTLRLSGTTYITRVTSQIPQIRVIFQTDGSVTKRGFRMKMQATEICK